MRTNETSRSKAKWFGVYFRSLASWFQLCAVISSNNSLKQLYLTLTLLNFATKLLSDWLVATLKMSCSYLTRQETVAKVHPTGNEGVNEFLSVLSEHETSNPCYLFEMIIF